MAEQMLQPGQIIRPQTTPEIASHLIEKLYGLTVINIKELVSYDDRNYFLNVKPEHSNPHIKEIDSNGYIFKILNSMDSKKKHVEAEHEMIALISKQGVECPQPVLRLDSKEMAVETIFYTATEKEVNDNTPPSSGEHVVRLLTFVPGLTLHSVPYKPRLIYQIGQTLGKVDRALLGFQHPALSGHQSIWNLISVPKLTQFLYAVEDAGNRKLVEEVISEFAEHVIPNLQHCTQAVIHGDYNEQNMLVRPLPNQEQIPDSDKEYEHHGIIDFGDACSSYVLFEVAITIMYVMVESKVCDPLLVGGYILAGFQKQMELNETERELMRVCVAARFCQSLVMGAYTYSMDPGNEYLLVTQNNGWRVLKKLWELPKDELYKGWSKVIEECRDFD